MASIKDIGALDSLDGISRHFSNSILLKEKNSISVWTLILTILTWPISKIRSFKEYKSSFWMALFCLFIEICIISGFCTLYFVIFYLTIYSGLTYSDIIGIHLKWKVNSFKSFWEIMKYNSGWQIILPEGMEEKKGNKATNKFTLLILILLIVVGYGVAVMLYEFTDLGENSETFLDFISISSQIICSALLILIIIGSLNEINRVYKKMQEDILNENGGSLSAYYSVPSEQNAINVIVQLNKKIHFWNQVCDVIKPVEISQTIGAIFMFTLFFMAFVFELELVREFFTIDEIGLYEMSAFLITGALITLAKIKISQNIDDVHQDLLKKNHRLNSELVYLSSLAEEFIDDDYNLEGELKSLGIRDHIWRSLINYLENEEKITKDPCKREKRFNELCTKMKEINELVESKYSEFHMKIEYRFLGVFVFDSLLIAEILLEIVVPTLTVILHLLHLEGGENGSEY